MKDEIIKDIEQNFLEFFPMYYQKFSAVFRDDDGLPFRCNKNQKRAVMLIQKFSGITSTELGQFLDMRKGSLTTLLDSLEEMGLLKRSPDGEDRRRVRLYLTTAGETYYNTMMSRHAALFSQTFGNLSEQELRDCLEGIKRVVATIRKL